MVMKASPMYASLAGASSSLVMLPSQPSLREVEGSLEEDENDYQADKLYEKLYAIMPSTPLSIQRGSPMARTTSQKRISLELSLGAANGSNSNLSNISNLQVNPRGFRTPTSNSPSMAQEDYRFPSTCTPTRQIPIRRHSTRTSSTADGLGPSHIKSQSNVASSPRGGDYFSKDLDSSEAAMGVPFPSGMSILSNSNAHPDSPSGAKRRTSRHLSMTGAAAASVESIQMIPASPPKNVAPIAIPSRPAYRQLRYSSDLQTSRNQIMTASRSDISMEEKSRYRMDSEGGSVYTNTLGSITTTEEGSSLPGVRLPRDASQQSSTTLPSKHKLVVVEDGKTNVTYQMGNCIGRGQFGSVYRALNLNTGQMVAVKRIKVEGLVESEVTQLMGEVDLLKSLSHPSVVKYEGLVRGPDVVSIILEFVENGSLLHTLKAFGNFPEKLVASYVVKILEGLNYLHEMKVVHCDLKAANILTTKNGNVKLSDFGVSLNLKAVKNIKNDAIGTPNWMAPEIIELKGASTAADIWSLGCTIIELLTGKPPYGDMLAMSALWRIVEDDCPPFPDKITSLLRDFLTLCFKKDPLLRPSAEMLFEHEWLRKTWNINMELRPQDSVPFLRRISADARALKMTDGYRDRLKSTADSEKSQMERSSSSPSTLLTLRPHLLSMRAASAPDACSMQPTQIEEAVLSMSSGQASPMTPSALPLTSSPPSMSLVDLMLRRSSDPSVSFDMIRSASSLANEKDANNTGVAVTSEPSYLDLNSPESFPIDEQTNKMHAFVKITFARAVVCKVCRDPVKKHAVLCEECGLICHASCTKTTTPPCNLRTQMLIYAAHGANRGSMDVVRAISPVSSTGVLSNGRDTPPMSPRLFKIPFVRTRKGSSAVPPPISIDVDDPAGISSPTTPTTPLPPLTSDDGTPTSQQRRRRFSLRPYMGLRQSPPPALSPDVTMLRSLSSSGSIPSGIRRDDSLGYGSSISSATSSGPGGILVTKVEVTSLPPLVKKPVLFKNRHSVSLTAAASTPHLASLERDKEAERKAKRRQSASVQRVTTPTDIPFPRSHHSEVTTGQETSSSMPPVVSSSAKRSRRLSSKQDCIIM